MAARSSRRQRQRRAGGVDLLSDLGDDLLVRVLELLPDTGDAVRTGALSRRWRGLWTRVPALRLISGGKRKFEGNRGAKRFLAFVDSLLHHRDQQAAAAALDHLTISFAMDPAGQGQQAKKQQLLRRSIEAAHKWIFYASQSGVRSFVFDLTLPLSDYRRSYYHEERHPTMNLTELASSPKLETLHLALDGVELHLPATAVFSSLADLSLESIEFPCGSGQLLHRLLSSACCPRLQRLQLRKLKIPQLSELVLEASALLELSCQDIEGDYLVVVELKTPSLRVLRMANSDAIETLRISAPRLEELTFLDDYTPNHIKVEGELSCIRSLQGIELYSHQNYYYESEDEDEVDDCNKVSICQLQCCTSVTRLALSLYVREATKRVDDIISGRIPHLPHLISLTVCVYLPELHSFGVGLADILTQCSNFKYLSVHCSNTTWGCDVLCNHLDHWGSHDMCLADIQEVEFTGLVGTNCERWFMQRVLTHATQLRKATLSFDPMFRPDDKRRSASKIIPGSSGTWTCCHHDDSLTYEWKPNVSRESICCLEDIYLCITALGMDNV